MPIPPELAGTSLGDDFVECYPKLAYYHWLDRATYENLLWIDLFRWTHGWLEADGSRTSRREPGQPFTMRRELKCS